MRQLMFLMIVAWGVAGHAARAAETFDVWPELAPGETKQSRGETLPFRANETPPVTRVINITQPSFTVYPAAEPNGVGVVILPGGGFGKVVPDKEGSEAAAWLNPLGITAFVVSYRTTPSDSPQQGWEKPLQDAQRTLSWVRANASRWQLKQDKIGLIGFSAGGQVAARLLSDSDHRRYEAVDRFDDVPYRPDFAMLIYPWNLYDPKSDQLADGIAVTKDCPPTFLLHTDDDRSTSLGTVLFYAGLKRRGIPAALHVFGKGGHGYGLRAVPGSIISTWPTAATHWLSTHSLTNQSP